MAKNNRFGQAEILSDSDYARIFKQISNHSHRLLLSIARFTGERWGAIVQLRVRDCYDESTHRTPPNWDNFPCLYSPRITLPHPHDSASPGTPSLKRWTWKIPPAGERLALTPRSVPQ